LLNFTLQYDSGNSIGLRLQVRRGEDMCDVRRNRRGCFLSGACAWILFLAIACLSAGSAAIAYDEPVEKKVFEVPSYTTVGDRTIKMLRMGYETYGKLNPDGDNAILIAPFFGGTSHAAGKYKADDRFPGYWDSIIGPGRPLDTNKFFVISFDGLANPNIKDGMTVTTGPASTDSDTGKRYGMAFPTITIRDFVNVQKALIDHLGVKRIYAVMGASMGGMQAFEWAAAYPDRVERIIPVVGAAQCDAFAIGRLESWMAPILLDPHWNGGDYYGKGAPIEGVKVSMKAVFMQIRHPDWANKTFERKWAAADKDPAKSMENLYAVQKFLDEASSELAARYDANHLIYQVRAIQLFSVGSKNSLAEGLKEIKAKVLLIPARNDLLFPPAQSSELRDLLIKQGNQVDFLELDGPLGHLNGIIGISQASDTITRFLSN
jgi:homoserine O-acetyltransferase/O-succinyltransferase